MEYMVNEKERSICKLNLDIGIHVENVNEVGKRKEDLFMRVYQHFGYKSPLDLIVGRGKNTYACKMYREDLENCKKCPAYQP